MSFESVAAVVYFLIVGSTLAVLGAKYFVLALPDKYGRDPTNLGLNVLGGVGFSTLAVAGPWLSDRMFLSVPAQITITAVVMVFWLALTIFMLAAKGRRLV